MYFLYFLIQSKKNGQNRKKLTFAHGPFFQFLAQKCQKYQFSWKNLFLRIFLWVISVRNTYDEHQYLNPLEPFWWEGYGTSPSGWNSGYHPLFSKMSLAGSNIGVCQKYRKHFRSEITHRKIVRKRFFHENWYFWHFWAKNWKNRPCTKVFFF